MKAISGIMHEPGQPDRLVQGRADDVPEFLRRPDHLGTRSSPRTISDLRVTPLTPPPSPPVQVAKASPELLAQLAWHRAQQIAEQECFDAMMAALNATSLR